MLENELILEVFYGKLQTRLKRQRKLSNISLRAVFRFLDWQMVPLLDHQISDIEMANSQIRFHKCDNWPKASPRHHPRFGIRRRMNGNNHACEGFCDF